MTIMPLFFIYFHLVISYLATIMTSKNKIFIFILCILGSRITIWNQFLVVGIGKPIYTEFLAQSKIKISCSITNQTEHNLTKFNQSW